MNKFSLVLENYRLTVQNFIQNSVASLLSIGTQIPTDVRYYNIPPNIDFIVSYNSKEESFFLKCKTIPSIYTIAKDIPTLSQNFNEELYEFHDVPREAALQMGIKYPFTEEFILQLEELEVKKGKRSLTESIRLVPSYS